MKLSPVLLACLALVAVSCERIPPSVSIPGYGEKRAAEETTESKPLGAAENPPSFFPPVGESGPAPAAPAVEKDDDEDGD